MNLIPPRPLPILAALLLGIASPLAAQTGQLAATAPTTKTDDVVKLSEFQVSDKSANSYIASETMTGSRVNTKIIDLPYSIVNLTSEFFSDFNVEILDENMTYIGGLTGINIGGSFNLRGFSATSQLRDGFYRLGRYGLSNIDRIEIIRGPNAGIYGRSSPGGMINFISLQPKKQDGQMATVSHGTYDQNLNNLYLVGSLDRAQKTYYVVDINQTYRQYPGGSYSAVRNDEGFAAIEHDFSDSSHFKVSAEYFLQTQHAPQSAPPTIAVARTATPDNTATSTVLGYDQALAYINPYGPNSELNRGSDTFQATYDKQINDVLSTRIGAYRFMARRWDYNSNTGWGSITVPAAGAPVTSTRGALPSRGEIMEDGGGIQADLVAHYFSFNHKVESKTLLTVDLNDYYRWDPTWEYGPNTDPDLVAWSAASSGRVVALAPGSYNGRTDYIPTASLTYFPKWYNATNLSLFAPGGNSIAGGAALNGGTLTRRRTTSLGGNISQQFSLLGGQLLVNGGLRNDTVLFSQRDYTVAFASVGVGPFPAGQGGANQPGGSVVRRYEHQNHPNAGLSYNLLPKESSNVLRAYVNYSSAYFVDQTSRPAVIAASTYAPFTSRGYDYGFKGSMLNQQLNFTFGGYYAKQYNVLVTDDIETPPGSGNFVSTPEQDGDQLVRGYEADVSWVFSNGVTTGASFGRVDSKYTNFGSAFPEVLGRSAQNISPENGSAYVKYAPTVGPLRSFYFNALVTYVSSTPTQAPNAGDTTAVQNGHIVVTGHTDAWKVRLPSFTLWNFAVHYKLPRLNQHWDQEVSLNVNNAFDKQYLKIHTALAGDGRSVFLEYQLSHLGSPHF